MHSAIGSDSNSRCRTLAKTARFDGKLKTAAREQLAQHLGNAEPLPEPPECPNKSGPPMRVQAMRPASMSDRACPGESRG
jgi:hypothetical protein